MIDEGASPNEPYLVMIAGPNGAGKTTLTNWLRQKGFDLGEYINADDIARELQGSYGARVAEAQRLADHRRESCITARRSFSFETVMSHPSKVEILAKSRSAGFFIQLFFVGIDDPLTNVERLALRVSQGGHDVPQDRIVARWYRTMELLSEAILASDRAYIFDNSTIDGPRPVFLWTSGNWQVMQSDPIPMWIKRYILDRLSIGSNADPGDVPSDKLSKMT
jgi:predicted ABC-type ATPase